MQRPDHLPDFTDPPLQEVVLGIQFSPVPGFKSVDAKDIWELYRKEFPTVQEQPMLPPQFEMFGGVNSQPGLQFQFSAGQPGSRLWFISEQENHLLQFQHDRFLTNWRKAPNLQPYPRFEFIAENYRSNLTTLMHYLASRFSYQISINQGEVTYTNVIPVGDFSEAGKWFSFWNESVLNIESLNLSFNEVIHDHARRPFARLFYSVQSVYSVNGREKALHLNLTFRGKPENDDVNSAMDFLAAGREAITTKFKAITTAYAHENWGLVK